MPHQTKSSRVLEVSTSCGNKEGDENWRDVELDETALMFFDVVLTILKCACEDDDSKCTDNGNIDFGDKRSADNMVIMGMSSVGEEKPDAEFDHFEYYDEDGDAIAVRTDDELGSFVGACQEASTSGEVLKIRLKSSKRVPSDNEEENDDDMEVTSIARRHIRPDDLHFIEKLSEGQFGTVYKALDTKTDGYLAVKSIALDNAMSSRASILNEIEILRMACTSAFIVDFYSAIFVDSELLICLELMDRLSLDRYGKLPSPVLGSVTVAVVGGLAYLWSKNIIHRDIKPSNFLVNHEGDVKLSDFGVSKQMAQSVAWSYVGTKVYMAPERINGDLYKIHSDIWSLGVSLLEMALGRFPFAEPLSFGGGLNQSKMVDNICYNTSAVMNHFGVSEDLLAHGTSFHKLISGCLKQNPFERIRPNEVVESEFLRENTPMNRGVIAEFVNDTYHRST